MRRNRLLPICMLLAVAACTSDLPRSERDREGGVSDEALHAVMTETIEGLLLQLEALVFDPHRTETELARLRQQRTEEIAEAAWELRTAADIMVRLPVAMDLPPEQRNHFRRLTGDMQQGATDLYESARDGNGDDFGGIMSRIQQSCDSCHDLYRAH